MSAIRSPCLSFIVMCALVLGAQPGMAADAPTQDEWGPVQAALASDAADAGTRVAAITSAYPNWVDGWVAAARYELKHQNPAQAYTHARKALQLENTNGDAAAIGMQALIAHQNPEAAIKLGSVRAKEPSLDTLSDGRAGWLSYYLALAHLALKDGPDLDGATQAMRMAKTHAGAIIPAEFHLVDARIAVLSGDVPKAEALLSRTVAGEPKHYDAWYELGRVRVALAANEGTPAGKRARLESAVQAFNTVTSALPQDHETWAALAQTRLELARLALNDGSDGGVLLRETVAAARHATNAKPDFGAAWAILGEAELRLERWQEASDALRKAQQFGSDDASVRGNLAIALQKTGNVEEALAVGGAMDGDATLSALVTRGLSALKADRYEWATASLQTATTHAEFKQQPSTVQGQILRFLGHAWTGWAITEDLTHREERLDQAAAAYRSAAEVGDAYAKRHFAAVQGRRDPPIAYAAGWTLIGWSPLSFRGWALVLANYGASRAWTNPLHLVIWGLLIGLPLLLWVKSLFHRSIPAETVRTSRSASAPAVDAPRQRQADSSSIRPSVRPKSEANALTARKSRDRSTDAATAPRPTAPRPGTKRRAPLPETEEIPKPGLKPGDKPGDKPRDKPRDKPGDKPGAKP